MSTPPNWPPPPPPPPQPPMPPAAPAGAPTYPPYYAPTPEPKKSSAVPIVVIFGGLFVLAMIAAIAIPSFLRARVSANEAAAIGTLQTVVSAEVTWAQGHGGRYAQPACLGDPASCADPQTPPLVMQEIAGLGPRSGYVFGFLLKPDANEASSNAGTAEAASETGEPGVSPPGTPTDAEVRAQLEQFSTPDTGASPPVLPAQDPAAGPSVPPVQGGFVFWATPQTAGRSGIRTFCVDETGLVRVYSLDTPWTAPAADDPRCPETGTPLG